MHASVRQLLFIMRPRLASLVPVIMLAALFLAFPPDGQERSPWLLFTGRFHLLTIHFPIALLYLVPILELAGRHDRLPHLKASVEFVLVLAMLGSLVAALLGWCLARSGGYSGHIVTQHMWGGLFTAAACWLCWMLRARLAMPYGGTAYIAALAVTVCLVSWTGYRGGQLTQGENHLTEGMPSGLRSMLGIPAAARASSHVSAPDSNTFYGARVEPILSANCYSCHGADKQRGELRLDSFAALMHGGKHGKIVVAGNAKGSELFHRVTLPQTDDAAMPPEGKRPLTAAEIKTLQLWIDAGATEMMPLGNIQGAPTDTSAPVEVTFKEVDAAAVEQARAPLAAAVAGLQKRYPNMVQYEARDSALLAINASLAGAQFGDADIAALLPVAGQIVTADFTGTSVSDRSGSTLAAMKHLRQVRLGHTRVTDATVHKLAGLQELQSLNLLGTGVSSASLGSLAAMPKMHYVYVAQTRITPGAATTPALKKELVF